MSACIPRRRPAQLPLGVVLPVGRNHGREMRGRDEDLEARQPAPCGLRCGRKLLISACLGQGCRLSLRAELAALRHRRSRRARSAAAWSTAPASRAASSQPQTKGHAISSPTIGGGVAVGPAITSISQAATIPAQPLCRRHRHLGLQGRARRGEGRGYHVDLGGGGASEPGRAGVAARYTATCHRTGLAAADRDAAEVVAAPAFGPDRSPLRIMPAPSECARLEA